MAQEKMNIEKCEMEKIMQYSISTNPSLVIRISPKIKFP